MGHRFHSYGHLEKLHGPSSHTVLLGTHRSSVLSVSSHKRVPSVQAQLLMLDSGAIYLLSIFYTRKEVATRIAILYTGNILATAFAGLIAIGIFKLGGVAGLAGWRWLFIIQGIVTFFVAGVGALYLPDDPKQTRWLTEHERLIAIERLQREIVQDGADDVNADGDRVTTGWQGLKEAASDYRVWLFVVMQHMHLAANGFKNFVCINGVFFLAAIHCANQSIVPISCQDARL